MEKEMNEKKKTKSITKKAKKMRSIVMMSLLCVLLLSAATYAWFTLSKTAKVAKLTMTVGEATGLQIAPDAGNGPGTYSGVLTFGDDGTPFGGSSSNVRYKICGNLKPATTSDGKVFYRPDYDDEGNVYRILNDNAVTKLVNGNDDESEGFYYETTFYLKALGDTDKSVKLRIGENLPKDSDSNYTGIAETDNKATGTYVLEQSGSSASKGYLGSQAVRISLTTKASTDPTESAALVYEPNGNVSGKDGTDADVKDDAISINPVASTSKQNNDGTWIDLDLDNTNVEQTKYLTLKANDDTLITMRIWIEGTDDECVNEISLNDIIAQLQFEEVE